MYVLKRSAHKGSVGYALEEECSLVRLKIYRDVRNAKCKIVQGAIKMINAYPVCLDSI